MEKNIGAVWKLFFVPQFLMLKEGLILSLKRKQKMMRIMFMLLIDIIIIFRNLIRKGIY